MRKGEEGYSIETATWSFYTLNQDSNHVTKSHVRIQFTMYRVNQGARLTLSYCYNISTRIITVQSALTVSLAYNNFAHG
jgi:hypothetical protein